MVIKINKTEFIKELSNKTGFNEDECRDINNIIEDTFIIGKKNKEKMKEKLKTELNYNDDEANKVYKAVMEILALEVKDKLKYPFKS